MVGPDPTLIDTSHDLSAEEHFQSLDGSLTLKPPVAANLGQAFLQLLDQALSHQFPAHPVLEDDATISPAVLKRVYAEIERAAQDAEGRIAVDQPRRKELRQIANPLKLGEMAETHFVLGQHWKNHFLKKEAQHGGPMTVSKLRTWIDEPSPMGLPRIVQHLVIMVFAAQTNRSFVLHNVPVEPTIENIADDAELHEQELPSETDWEKAVRRGAVIFGVTASPLLNAANLARFVADVKKKAEEVKPSCDSLMEGIRQLQPGLSEPGTEATRFQTARATKLLVDAVVKAPDDKVVEIIAKAQVASSEEAMGTHLKKAGALVEALSHVKWDLLEGVRKLTDHRQQAAEAIWENVKATFQKDEYAVALAPMLREAEKRAVKLLTDIPEPVSPPATPQPPVPEKPKQPSYKVIARGVREGLTETELDELVEEIRSGLNTDAAARLNITWGVVKP